MRGVWAFFAVLAAAFALVAPAAYAGLAPEARETDLKARLDALAPEARKKLVESLNRWRTMSEQEREAIRDRLETFKTLPDDEKESLSERLKKWRSQDPGSKGEIRKRFADLRGMPDHARESLASRLRLFAGLPAAEQQRIAGLPAEQRRAELERLFQLDEISRLSRALTADEREELKSLPVGVQRERAMAILAARKAENLARMPESMRVGLEAMPRRDKAAAEDRFLREIAWRDQMVAMVLPKGQRHRFAKAQPSERDGLARRFLEENGERLFSRLPAQARARVESASESERPWVLLGEAFQSDLARIQSSLLPSQVKSLKDATPQKAWEKTRGFLNQNHRRLLSRLPREFGEEISGLAPEEQAKRVRQYLESELDKLPIGRLQKAGIRELPPALMFEAIARHGKLRKQDLKQGRGED